MRKQERFGKQGGEENRNGVLLALILVALAIVFVFLRFAKAQWSQDRYYLMAIVGEEKISIRGVNVEEERGYELIIPGNVMIPVVGMEGSLKASSLWQFGEDEGEPEKVVRYSIEQLLGVRLNGVIKTADNEITLMDIWRSGGEGELSDRLRFFRAWKRLRSDQRTSVGIANDLGQIERTPDGEEVIKLDEMGLKNWVQEFWTNTVILDERIGIEVINSSGVDGMGRLAESMILSAGGLVLKVDSGEEKKGECFYAARKEFHSSATISWIKDQLGCSEIKDEEGIGVKLWVGQEFGERYERG